MKDKGKIITIKDLWGNRATFVHDRPMTEDEETLIQGFKDGRYSLLLVVPKVDGASLQKISILAQVLLRHRGIASELLTHDNPHALLIFAKQNPYPRAAEFKKLIEREARFILQ